MAKMRSILSTLALLSLHLTGLGIPIKCFPKIGKRVYIVPPAVLLLTLFQSYQDNGWVIMKFCVQQNPVYDRKGLYLLLVSNLGLLDQQPELDLLSYRGFLTKNGYIQVTLTSFSRSQEN